MEHAKRGNAVIFNHENFDFPLGLKSRTGTAVDRDCLSMRLRDLGFDVTCFNDVTFHEIESRLTNCKISFKKYFDEMDFKTFLFVLSSG